MKMFTFWRSLASFRVRIALNLKNLLVEYVFVDIDANGQRQDSYRDVNPQMVLPALIDGEGAALFQSIAILEYLDETHPQPPLLPADPRGRARVRGIAMMIACDAHPLLTPRVRQYLGNELKVDDSRRLAWSRHWTSETLKALEARLSSDKETGAFCHGDAPTMADICLAGHVAGAAMMQLDLAPYPTVKRIVTTAMAIPAFAKAHPLAQPDTPEAMRPKPA
ncbi:MAG: maleylacetoacetate isomerase [Proteobacteria bacterium SG_bin9]|nr:MAG: maleylacetoacetate isomerase [Proteobacteria bacterium SG_bin9]